MSSSVECRASAPVGLPVRLMAWAVLGMALNVGLARLCYGIILPSLRRDLGLSYAAAGALNAGHLAGYLVGTLAAPSIGRWVGMRRLAQGGLAVVAGGAALSALGDPSAAGFASLAVGRFASGLGASAAIVATMVLMFSTVAPRLRAAASALAYAGMGVALVAGGLAAPWIVAPGEAGWRGVFVATAVLAVALTAWIPAAGPAPATDAPTAGAFALRQVLSGRWCFLFGSYLLFGVGYIAFATFFGASLAASYASAGLVSLTWTVLGAATMCGAISALWLQRAPRLRQWALTLAALSGALGSVAACSAFGGAALGGAALGGAVLVGLSLASIPAIVAAAARDRCEASEYPRVFSLATLALSIGQLIGPVAAGFLADRLGAGAAPVLAAAAYGAGCLLALLDARRNQ